MLVAWSILQKFHKESCQIGDPAGYLGIPTFFQFSQQVDKTSCTGNSFNLTLCSELSSGKPAKWPDKKIKSLSKRVQNWNKSQKESNHAAFVWSLTFSYTSYIDPANAAYHKVWIFNFLGVPTPRAWPRRNFFTQISTEFLLAFHVAPIQKILREKVPEFDTIEKKSVPPKVVIIHVYNSRDTTHLTLLNLQTAAQHGHLACLFRRSMRFSFRA